MVNQMFGAIEAMTFDFQKKHLKRIKSSSKISEIPLFKIPLSTLNIQFGDIFAYFEKS